MGDPKILLHVGFGRGPTVKARVGIDKRQILALLWREGFCRRTHSGHPIQLFVCASKQREARMNVRYRVDAARKLKRGQILLAADAGASD